METIPRDAELERLRRERVEREQLEEKRRRRAARRNQERELRMSRSYVAFLTMSVIVFGVFAITSLISGLSAPVLAARQVRIPSAPAAAAETVVQFGDRILVQDCGVQIWFDYREITAVKILDHFSVLQVGRWEAIILAPSGFSKGDRFTFWRFFRAKRPDLWAKTAA